MSVSEFGENCELLDAEAPLPRPERRPSRAATAQRRERRPPGSPPKLGGIGEVRSRSPGTRTPAPASRGSHKSGVSAAFPGHPGSGASGPPRHLELREGVQPRLLHAPIEWTSPVVYQAPKIVDVRPIEPVLPRPIRETECARDARASPQYAVGNAKCEWSRHRLLLVRCEAIQTSALWCGFRKPPPPKRPSVTATY